MKKVTSVDGIKDPYTKRILSNILQKDPLRIYAETPSRLMRLVGGLSDKQMRAPRKGGNWSVAQIVAHLCDAELVMGYRIRKVIAESKPRLESYDQDRWAKNLHYLDTDVRTNLRLLRALRDSHLSLLAALKPRELRRYGIHSERGKETVERMVQMLAGHDVNHIRQVASIRSSLKRANR